jgi:hypothetical protein
MPSHINFEEAGLRQSALARKPNDRLIESSLFGLPAIWHKKFQRFNLRNTVLHILSFVTLQIQHENSLQILDLLSKPCSKKWMI